MQFFRMLTPIPGSQFLFSGFWVPMHPNYFHVLVHVSFYIRFLRWGSTDAEIITPSASSPQALLIIQNYNSSGSRQNIALYALPTASNSAFLLSSFNHLSTPPPLHPLIPPPLIHPSPTILFRHQVTRDMNGEWD